MLMWRHCDILYQKIGNTETCENWLSLENSYIYYAHKTHEIYQALPYSVDF